MKVRIHQALTITMVLGFLLCGTSEGMAQQKSLKGQLAGAWTMVSQELTTKEGSKGPGNGGPNAVGILILDASGHFAYVAGQPNRPKLKTTLRKDIPAAELGEAVRPFGANFGTWSVNEADKTMTRKFQLALIPNNDTNEVKHSVTLAKEELRLVSVSAAGTKTETVYRRAK